MKLKKHSHYLFLLVFLVIVINPLALSLGSYFAGEGGRFIASAIMGSLIIIYIIMWISFHLAPKEKIIKTGVNEKINTKESNMEKSSSSSAFKEFIVFRKRNSKTNSYLAIITFSVFLIGLSVFYSLVYLPYKKDGDFKKCLADADDIFLQNKQKIDLDLDVLEKNKKSIQNEIDEKLVDFAKNNPEPENKISATQGGGRLAGVLTNEHSQWERKKESISNPMREVENKIKALNEDLVLLEKEKESNKKSCFVFR